MNQLLVQNDGMSSSYTDLKDKFVTIEKGSNIHYLSVDDLISISVSDIILMGNGIPFTNVTLCHFYWKYVLKYVRELIDATTDTFTQKSENLMRFNIILVVSLSVGLLLCSIPIFLSNRLINRQ
jgi:hypothetical protein